MLIFWAVLGGFVLDALFGDPAWLPHPVVVMGRCIAALEKRLRAALPGMAKSAFFLLQDAAWLEKGVFAENRRALLPLLRAEDARLLALDEAASLDDAVDALLTACRGLMERI